jgi:hypothetical protein
LFFFIIRVYLLLLFFEGSKGDELHGGSNTGRPQERGRMSRYALLLLDVDHARVLLLHQGNVRIVIHFPFKLPYFKNSEEGGCVGGGSAGGLVLGLELCAALLLELGLALALPLNLRHAFLLLYGACSCCCLLSWPARISAVGATRQAAPLVWRRCVSF